MKMLLLLTLNLLLLAGCSAPVDPETSDPGQEDEFQISFNNLATHGSLLSYSVQGDSNRNFGLISFHTSPDCSLVSRVISGDRTDIVSGMIINLSGANTSHGIYYSVTDPSGVVLVQCELLSSYTHDSIAPAAPTYAPASFISQNGLRTRDILFIPQIGSSFIPSGADGIRFYGNATKTIYMGEVMRTSLLTGGVNLTINSANLFYISFVDLARNESALYNTGIGIINDSVAPTTPVATQALTRYVTTPTINLQATTSLDTNGIVITHRETAIEYSFTRAALAAGVSLPASLNTTNNYDIVAIDDVGNESLPLTYVVVNDSIAPATPTLHTDTQELISLPVRGPGNTFKFLMGESGSISVYSNPGLTNLITTGTTSSWETGIVVTFPMADGSNTIYVVGIDMTGNASTPIAITFTADTTNPSNLSLIPASLALHNSFQQSMVAPIRATANTDIANVVITGGVSTETYTMAEILAGINYALNPNILNNLIIKSIDLAGNESTGIIINVTNDTIAPNATVTFPVSNGKTIAPAGVIRGICEANSVTVNIGTVFVVPCVGGIWSLGLDGSYLHGAPITIRVTETDNALNITSVTRTATIDNVAPIITVDPTTLPAVSNNANHLLMGNCESGPTVYISGDSSGAIPCLGGFFVIPLNILSEGTRSFTLTQTDEALNIGTRSFSLNFDFTAPPTITLATSVTNLHNTAIQTTNINVIGNSVEDVSIKIFSDPSFTQLIGTYTKAQLTAGIILSLGSDRENPFYVVAEDAAGNKSIPAYVSVFQRLALSKKYETLQDNIYLSSDVGVGVTYRYKILVTNISTDTNINRRILLESMTVTSPTPQIVVSPASTCLTGSTQGFGTCEIWIDITYTTVASNDFDLTITYPNATTDTINIQHKTANVLNNASAVLPATLPTNIFTDDLFETRNAEAFTTIPYYVDQGFALFDQAALGIRRRTQAYSSDKLYTVCAGTQTRLCAYARATPSMEETMFNEVVLSTVSLDEANIPSIMVWHAGTIGTKDIIIVSKFKNAAFATDHSAMIVYDKSPKTYVVYWLREGGSDYLSVQRPKYGNMLVGNNFYFMGRYTGGQGLYRVDVTTGVQTKLDTARNSSSYFRTYNQLVYSKSTMEVISRSTVNDTELPITSVNLAQNLHICDANWFTSGKVMNVEDRNDFSTGGHHSVYFLCDATNVKKKAVYAHDTDHTVIRDVTGTADGLWIQNLLVIDQYKTLFTIRRSGTLHLYHHYIDTDNNVSSSIQETYPDANYKSIPIYIDGKIYKQNQNVLTEYDLTFSPLRNLNDFGHRNWYLFKSSDTPYVMQFAAKTVTYYDLDFDQWLNYANLATAIPVNAVNFEGFFRGHLYLRDGVATSARFVRIPLYSK